jgi:hypothetical protein
MASDLTHRRDTDNTVIATWSEHFNPLPTSFDAQAYEVDKPGQAVEFQSGDHLVFRFAAANTIQAEAWIPNGDGKLSNRRIPHITLQK